MEFLVTMTTRVPDSMPADAVERVRAREAARSRELAAQGKLLRLWRPPLRPGEWRTLGLFAADDNGELEQLLASMPPRSWRTDDVTPLGAHPNDPVGQGITIAPGKGPEFLIATTIMVPPGTPAQVVDDTARGSPRARAGRAGTPGAVVGTTRRTGRPAHPGAVAGSRPWRADGHPGIATACWLDDHRDHAAESASR